LLLADPSFAKPARNGRAPGLDDKMKTARSATVEDVEQTDEFFVSNAARRAYRARCEGAFNFGTACLVGWSEGCFVD